MKTAAWYQQVVVVVNNAVLPSQTAPAEQRQLLSDSDQNVCRQAAAAASCT